jgi:exo-1,4-beta-D-glucosaminidase
MFFMDKSYAILLRFLFIAGTFVTPGATDPLAQSSSKILLNGPWALQSSCEVKAAGDEISNSGFKTQGWHRTEVPSTVVAALVADKTYPDPYLGMNLRSFPGVNYRIGAMFSNLQMPDDSPFRCSWWYRSEFKMPLGYKEKTAWLHFDGINYRANVWLNGHQLANAKDMVGTFRAFEFDVSKLVGGGKQDTLAV